MSLTRSLIALLLIASTAGCGTSIVPTRLAPEPPPIGAERELELLRLVEHVEAAASALAGSYR